MGDYDYKSIRDKQIGRELVFKIGVYTVAAFVAVPCVLTGNAPGALLSFSIASYVCGSTSVTGAITGTNPISGRTISSDERWVEGISGSVQVLSGAYGIYSYAPPAFSYLFNTTSPTIGSVADIVDDVNNGADEGAKFGDKAKLESHFSKHGSEFKGAYSNADEYLQGAKDVMKNGTKIEYTYKGEVRNGYVKFMENNFKGQAKFEFVGTNAKGDIATYHVESGKTFWKMLNGENIPVINPVK